MKLRSFEVIRMEKTFIIMVNGIPIEIEVKIQRIYVSEDVKRELNSIA